MLSVLTYSPLLALLIKLFLYISLNLLGLGFVKMSSGSPFDPNLAFFGGGFMSTQSTQYNDSSPSAAKTRENQGLIPLTVKQISEAYHSGEEKSNFVVSGKDVTNVTLVGMVFNKEERNIDVNFTLDDGTGRMPCRRWVNETFDKMEMDEIQNEMYVRVIGSLKVFQGIRQLNAFTVRPVKNFDEVAFHFIECIHTYLLKSMSQPGSAAAHHKAVGASLSTPVKSESSGNQSSLSNQFSDQCSDDGVTGCSKFVLDYLRQPSNMENVTGIHRDELSKQLRIPMDKIMESIKYLESEGVIYPTIDDFHFKAV